MKISLKWLNDYVDVSDYFKNTNDLADILTRAGLEVEEIKDLAAELNHVVVGHVKVKDKHPNADKLSLCQVEIAPGKIEQIVCGAQNHKAGDKVIVALPGAVLPGNFAIKKSKIRDVESNGMLCSYKEIGQTDKVSDGIVILPADAQVGTPYAQYAGMDDVTFELKVTPNRADCLSHYGLAREIGCLLNRKVKPIETYSKFTTAKTTDKIKLNVESDLCNRYSGRYVANVKIGPSPEWLKNRLESIGMNSINNVVDVTNYVMLELGQPLHAFDADSLAGQTVNIRKAKANEKFKTLKEQEITLKGEELLICDGEKAVALAGVIGGLNSGVSDTTKNIFVESANFNSMSTRKSSRGHGIETDSAYRFSRGVDPSQTVTAMDRAILLMIQCAGGEAYSSHHDVYPKPIVKKPINITIKTIADRLGYAVDANLFEQFMTGLQCEVKKNGDGYSVTPPLFRFDIEQDMDLVEEYARLNGYEKIQETLPAFHQSPTIHDAFYILKNKISTLMQGCGFSQAFNYAFASGAHEVKFIQDAKAMQVYGLKTDAQAVTIRNPLSEDLNVMRRSAAYSLWKNTIENFHMGNERGQIFEIGSVFSKLENTFKESNRLTLSSWGNEFGLYSNQTPNVYKVRASVERLFQMLGINSYTFKEVDTKLPFLHYGQSAAVVIEGKLVGFIGTVHPQLIQQEKIRVDVAIAELDLDTICQGQPRPMRFKSVSGFQAVERDFSFIISSDKTMGDFMADVKKSLGAVCKDVRIFDIYQGDKLDKAQKSVSVRVTMQSNESDLTEAMITENVNKIMISAEKLLGAKLR